MVDTEGYNRIVQSAETTRMAVESEKWAQATDLWARTEQVILDATDNVDFYNILYKTQPRRSSLVSKKANAPLNRGDYKFLRIFFSIYLYGNCKYL